MTYKKREGIIKQVTVRQDGPVLLAEVAMALLLADLCAVAPPSSSPPLCGVQVMMGSHDGEMNGGASLVAWAIAELITPVQYVFIDTGKPPAECLHKHGIWQSK